MQKENNRLCFYLFGYAFCFAFFQIMPTFLGSYMSKPLTWGDMLDFMTPLAVVPMAYLVVYNIKKITKKIEKRRFLEIMAGIIVGIGFILYINGHGIHLSANAIARLVKNMKGTELYQATYLLDEVISHFMWDGGVFLLSIGMILFAIGLPFGTLGRRNLIFIYLSAAVYAFTFTVNGIEGQTVVLTFPAACAGFLLSLFLYISEQKKAKHNPVFLFFCAAYLLSVILFACWGIIHSGFPEFSALGWI